MDSVLLIAESSTLRYLLQRSFRAFPENLLEATTYEDGLQQLHNEENISGIVVSWPALQTDEFADLLGFLSNPQYSFIPTVIVASQVYPEALEWTQKRAHGALTLLAQYDEIPDILLRLREEDSAITGTMEAVKDISKHLHILFVDDSRSTRAYYERLLEKHGYIVTLADSVQSAWEILESKDISVDLVITDYFMPGENGYKLCRRIRKSAEFQHIPTAVMTGTYLDDVIDHSLRSGAIECMFKEEIDDLFLARVASMARMAQDRQSIMTEQQRLGGILSSLGEGVYGVDNSGRINFINPAALRILGYHSVDSLIGQKTDYLLYDLKTSRTAVPLHEAYSDSEELRDWQTLFTTRARKRVPVSCTVVPLTVSGKRRGSVVAFRDISRQLLMERQLRWQATRDSLTKLYNRRYFEEQMEHELKRIKRTDETSALLYLDLDRFKYINDTAGHDAGDKILVMASKELAQRVRESDTLARIGGDEFAVILRNINPPMVKQTADSFRDVLANLSFIKDDYDFKVHGSIGVALFNKESLSANDIMAHADIACHQAKAEGRNQTHVYQDDSDVRGHMSSELGWANRLQQALDDDAFEMLYHPILAVEDIDFDNLPDTDQTLWSIHHQERDRPPYIESLIRMRDENGEYIKPNLFLGSAERFGLMPRIDTWVVNKALETLEHAHDLGLHFTVGVNLSAITLEDPEALATIINKIKNSPISAEHLALEITERSAITNLMSVKAFIEETSALGCMFALDDFGAGFSSFSQLRNLPVDFVKIDGEYVKNMAHDKTDRTVVNAINDIAHSVGRETIAEYVVDPDTLLSLRDCGIDYVQGHYVSEPMTEEELFVIHSDEPTVVATALAH